MSPEWFIGNCVVCMENKTTKTMYLLQNYKVCNNLCDSNSFYANLGRTIKTLKKVILNYIRRRKRKKNNNIQKEIPLFCKFKYRGFVI